MISYIERVLRINKLASPQVFDSLSEQYYHLALLEDYHRNISISVCDVMCMVEDVANCFVFLLDRFGCYEWPTDTKSYKASSDSLPVQLNLEVVRHDPAQDMNGIISENVKVRNPFLKMSFEVNSEQVFGMFLDSHDETEYKNDVYIILRVLQEVMAVERSANASMDSETNVSVI
jgi:hypothetical protein